MRITTTVERLDGGLQLCRSLSGAVILTFVKPSGDRRRGFNCAAPFRERL